MGGRNQLMSTPGPTSATPTFLRSDRRLARAAQPIARFLHVEAAGGILLLLATVIALVWANSPWQASYGTVWSTPVRIEIGSHVLDETLGHLVNDMLMAIFFFVVGMEIKREFVVGELRDRRAVGLPVMAALGGMIVPAVIYIAFNASGAGAKGWGIPMATDIAFALGIVALLDSRVPPTIKVLLLTLAIVDDIGAIIVIAIFYAKQIRPGLLLVAAGLVVVIAVMHRLHIVYSPLYVVVGLVLWLSVYESGVHATIAGVIFGLLMPATPMQTQLDAAEVAEVLEGRPNLRADDARATARAVSGSVSACDLLIETFHPWTSYVIVPLFALANAGIALSRDSFSEPSAVLLGVAIGLVVGKFFGVITFSWLAVRLGIGRLPDGARWGHIFAVGAVAGIGFTVSLFISSLAFDDVALQDDAKIGTLVASVVAAGAGALAFALVARRDAER
jgi:NhaA family Na+:H+ antiporter